MSDDFRIDPFAQPPEIPDDDRGRGYPYDDRRPNYRDDNRRPEQSRRFPPLPPWLARKHLRPDEQVVWVAGPRFNPSWEKYVTHPLLFVAALALGAVCLGAGWTMDNSGGMMAAGGVAAFVLVIGSIIVLGLCCGYFTRLVATNHRLLILQGYEVCRRWNIDDLPRHMVRYGRRDGGESTRPSTWTP